MQGAVVVVVGVGTVGSQIAMKVARCGVGRLRLIDGDHLEEPTARDTFCRSAMSAKTRPKP